MFAVFLLIVALSGFSDALGNRRPLPPPAVPNVIPLANFTEVLQRAAAFLSTSGRHTVDLDPCVPRPVSLRLWMERIMLQDFHVHGVSEASIKDVRQEPGDKAAVYFTLTLPRVDAVGLARLMSSGKVANLAVNTKETQVSFKMRAQVRVVKNQPRILTLTVARSDRPVLMKTWLSEKIDSLDFNMIHDVLVKILDPCITEVAKEFAAIANAYLRVPKIPSNHKISAAVAELVDSRMTPAVPLTPLAIKIPIKAPLFPCKYQQHPIALTDTKIDGLANCTYSEAAKDGRDLQMVYECDPLKVTANVTILDSKPQTKKPVQLSIKTKTFVKLTLIEKLNRRAMKINIKEIHVNNAYLFSYDIHAIQPKTLLANAASECFKKFIFIEDTDILREILHFDRR